MQDYLPERDEMMLTMMEMEGKMAMAGRRHLRRQVGVAGIVWRGRVVPSQGKVSYTRLPPTLLCTAGAHCTWQVNFVQASGEFRTKLKYLPGGSVAV